MHRALPLLFLIPYLRLSRAATVFLKKDEFVGGTFFDNFDWETFNDPTHGRVNYVDRDNALQHNLSYATPSKFVMRADAWSTVPPEARGRDSVRISSHASYDEAVFVLDLAHMPTGCSTWPAFWTLSATGPWPKGGEIDIIEGVNLGTQNLASLHALPGCSVTQSRSQTGTTISTDCNTQVSFNQGCGTLFTTPDAGVLGLVAGDIPQPGELACQIAQGAGAGAIAGPECGQTQQSAPSFGAPFNAGGGGFYAMSKTRDSGIAIWFWPRGSQSVPPEVAFGSEAVVPSVTWGTPAAYFPLGDNCPYDGHFDAHKIVFDLTLCGDWAGSMWAESGCGAGTCDDYVNNNPRGFEEAYWEINSLRVYTSVAGGW